MSQKTVPAIGVYSLLGSLVQPIFHGGALRGQLVQNEAHYQELVLGNYRQAVLSAFGEVETAPAALDAAAAERSAQEALRGVRRAAIRHDGIGQPARRYRNCVGRAAESVRSAYRPGRCGTGTTKLLTSLIEPDQGAGWRLETVARLLDVRIGQPEMQVALAQLPELLAYSDDVRCTVDVGSQTRCLNNPVSRFHRTFRSSPKPEIGFTAGICSGEAVVGWDC